MLAENCWPINSLYWKLSAWIRVDVGNLNFPPHNKIKRSHVYFVGVIGAVRSSLCQNYINNEYEIDKIKTFEKYWRFFLWAFLLAFSIYIRILATIIFISELSIFSSYTLKLSYSTLSSGVQLYHMVHLGLQWSPQQYLALPWKRQIWCCMQRRSNKQHRWSSPLLYLRWIQPRHEKTC